MADNVKLMKSNGEIFNSTLSIETSWNNIEGKPTNFVPTAHNHNAEDITTTNNKQFVSSAEKANWAAKETTSGAQDKADQAENNARTYTNEEIGRANIYTDTEVGKVQTNLNAFKNQKGVSSGLAELDNEGHVPSSQLPSYVDDVLSFSTLNDFPTTGESGKIYVTKDTNKTYRWDGTNDYVEISKSLALGETSSTAYAGNKGVLNKSHIDDIMDGKVTVDRAKKDGEGLQIRGNYVRNSELYTEGVIKENLIPLKSLPELIFQITSPQDEIRYDGTDTILLDLYNEFANKANTSHNHKAADINSGVLLAQRIPNLPISKIEDLDNTLSAMATAIAGKAETNHTHSQYLTDAPTTGGEYVRKSGGWVVSSAGSEHDGRISDTNILNWNAAYGWGNHASAGYLKSAPNDYVVFGKYTTPPSGKRWVGTSTVSNPYYDVKSISGNLSSSELPSPSGLPAGRTGRVYTATLPIQEAYYIVQEIEVDHGLITLTRTNGGEVEFTIPKPDGGGGGDLSGYVPTSRTIAGKNLESDITVASLQSALNVPTDLDDLVVAGTDQVLLRTAVGWAGVSQVPDSTRWGGYRIRVGSYSSGTSGYVTFGI